MELLEKRRDEKRQVRIPFKVFEKRGQPSLSPFFVDTVQFYKSSSNGLMAWFLNPQIGYRHNEMNLQLVKEKVTMLRGLFRSSMDFLDDQYEGISEASPNKSKAYLAIENSRADMIQCISQCIGHHQTEETGLEEVITEVERIKAMVLHELKTLQLETEEELV